MAREAAAKQAARSLLCDLAQKLASEYSDHVGSTEFYQSQAAKDLAASELQTSIVDVMAKKIGNDSTFGGHKKFSYGLADKIASLTTILDAGSARVLSLGDSHGVTTIPYWLPTDWRKLAATTETGTVGFAEGVEGCTVTISLSGQEIAVTVSSISVHKEPGNAPFVRIAGTVPGQAYHSLCDALKDGASAGLGKMARVGGNVGPDLVGNRLVIQYDVSTGAELLATTRITKFSNASWKAISDSDTVKAKFGITTFKENCGLGNNLCLYIAGVDAFMLTTGALGEQEVALGKLKEWHKNEHSFRNAAFLMFNALKEWSRSHHFLASFFISVMEKIKDAKVPSQALGLNSVAYEQARLQVAAHAVLACTAQERRDQVKTALCLDETYGLTLGADLDETNVAVQHTMKQLLGYMEPRSVVEDDVPVSLEQVGQALQRVQAETWFQAGGFAGTDELYAASDLFSAAKLCNLAVIDVCAQPEECRVNPEKVHMQLHVSTMHGYKKGYPTVALASLRASHWEAIIAIDTTKWRAPPTAQEEEYRAFVRLMWQERRAAAAFKASLQAGGSGAPCKCAQGGHAGGRGPIYEACNK